MRRLKRRWHCKIVFMRIAIVKLSALGDIVHAMVVLQFIKKYKQDISIDWFVEKRYKELLEFNTDINQIHLVNLKKAKEEKSFFILYKEFKKLRQLDKYDMVIDMQGLVKSALFARLIPSEETIGFDNHSARESLASFFYNKTFSFDYKRNIIERNMEIVSFALGFFIDPKIIQFKIPFLIPSKSHPIKNLSKIKKNIVLIPGASTKSKCYPVKSLASLTKKIDANFIIIWGNKKEKMLADELRSLSSSVNISNKLSIDALISLISKVDLVIGPDTGPSHLAWGLNVPSIVLFGSTPGYRNSYLTKNNKIIESSTKVNPYKINKNDYSIRDIPVKKIVELTNALIF